MSRLGRYRLLGTTRDDAAASLRQGATLLAWAIRGGRNRTARGPGRSRRFSFPRHARRRLRFSFSGLKTGAARRAGERQPGAATGRISPARSRRGARRARDELERAVRATGYRTAVLGGAWRATARSRSSRPGALRLARVAVASPRLNADNGHDRARRWHRLGWRRSIGPSDARADLRFPAGAATIPNRNPRSQSR